MSNKITITMREKLINEIEFLKTVRRHEVAEKIKEARSFGDLSENSEYDEAKNEQAKLESRIAEIEDVLSKAQIIEDGTLKTDVVDIGCEVKVYDFKYKEEEIFIIVSPFHADPSENKISDESPLGLALCNQKVGDIVSVDAPEGIIEFKILSIGVPSK